MTGWKNNIIYFMMRHKRNSEYSNENYYPHKALCNNHSQFVWIVLLRIQVRRMLVWNSRAIDLLYQFIFFVFFFSVLVLYWMWIQRTACWIFPYIRYLTHTTDTYTKSISSVTFTWAHVSDIIKSWTLHTCLYNLVIALSFAYIYKIYNIYETCTQ